MYKKHHHVQTIHVTCVDFILCHDNVLDPSSTGDEDHHEQYQQQQQQHHIYPVTTDYYDAEGQLITSEEVYYEDGGHNEEGTMYEDGKDDITETSHDMTSHDMK